MNGSETDGRRDFDFLLGDWTVRNRRLKERLAGSTAWEAFDATCHCRTILGGLGNLDEFTLERASGLVRAITVRLFSPASREWSIYWSAGSGRFDVPMVGRFDGGRGEFYAQEVFERRHIFSRFVWTSSPPRSCRWEQAYSADGGRTWETNWTMEFTRVP